MAKGLIILLIAVSLSLGVEILSKSLRTNGEGNVIAEGEVEAQYREYLIRADRVKYNPRSKEVFAYGNVYIEKKDKSLIVKGSQAYLNLKEEKGYFLDAQGRFREFYFSAKKVEKVGDKLYHVYEGDITTCPPENKELKLCFLRARVSDRYVLSLSNSFKFFNLPVFYSPLAVFPVGKRRSGLLPPMIGSNSYNNFIYIQPIYWAISRDKDATLTLDYRDKQARGVWLEYRQAFSWKDRLYMRLSYYKEPQPLGEWWEGRSLSTFRENRFRIELRSSFKGWKLGLDLPSDPYFFEDIYFSQKDRTVPFTLSYLNYTELKRDYLLTLNLRSYYDLTSDTNRRTLHLLPEAGFYSRPKRLGPAYLSLTSTFTNFYREGDLRSKRLIFTPQAELPLKLFGITDYMSLKFINNFYFTEGEEGLDERVSTFLFENRLPIFHSLSLGRISFSNILELVYSFSPEDYNNPQFDSFDNVTKESNLRLRYSASMMHGGRSVASLFLEGGYNLLGSYRFPTDSALIKEKMVPFRAILSLYPTQWLSLNEDTIYDANLGIFARSTSSAGISIKSFKGSLSYVVTRNSTGKRISDQYTVRGELGIRTLLLGGSLTKDNLSGQELYRTLYLGFRGACWTLKVDYRRTYYGTQKGYLREVFVVFNLFNLRELKLPLRRK